jgi:hypothetical protein
MEPMDLNPMVGVRALVSFSRLGEFFLPSFPALFGWFTANYAHHIF